MKSQKGQALVETALILPILLMFLFGITDFGRIFHVYLTLDHAGREAARAAAVGWEDPDIDIEEIVESACDGRGLNLDKLDIDILLPGKDNGNRGDNVTITLTYEVDFLTPIIGQFFENFDLENITVMRVE